MSMLLICLCVDAYLWIFANLVLVVIEELLALFQHFLNLRDCSAVK
jgi:hypothetical protein